MSTTFEVYPASDYIPSFDELLFASTKNLTTFLQTYTLPITPNLQVKILQINDETNLQQPFSRHQPVWWAPDYYAWFSIGDVPGGTDVYARETDEMDRTCLIDEATRDKKDWVGDLLSKTLQIGRYWKFRRSAGQPAIINLAYGIIAGSLAELTGGFLHSSDNAWDYSILPARAGDFLGWYFRPELTTTPDKRMWAQRCLKQLQTVQNARITPSI